MDRCDLELISELGLLSQLQEASNKQLNDFAHEIWNSMSGDDDKDYNKLELITKAGVPVRFEYEGSPVANILPDADKGWRQCVKEGVYKLEIIDGGEQ